MNIRTREQINTAKKCGDIFTNDMVEAKKEYHEYCKRYHPDNGSINDYFIFEIIQQLWEDAQKLFQMNSWEVTGQIRIVKEDGHGFELNYKEERAFEFGKVYISAKKIAYVYEKKYEDFYYRYLHSMRKIRFADDKMKKEMERFLPKVVTSLKTAEGEFCILLDKTSDVYCLASIAEQYQKKNKSIPERQVAWMLNRLFNFNCYLNWLGFAHNGLTLEHIYVSPDWHSLFFYGGWEYMTRHSEKMIGCPSEVYSILPFVTKDNKKTVIGTDLYSTKAIGKMLLGLGASTLFKEYLKKTPKKDPIEEWNSYQDVLRVVYGESKFVTWDIEYDLK